jgi:uncharacterized damage-inducible protein DinB
MTHPLVLQLRFTRNEFQRALAGIGDDDARKRLMPMNSMSWMIGHLAWQEQRYWLTLLQGKTPLPALNTHFGWGKPATTPPLAEAWTYWHAIVNEAEPFLDTLTTDDLMRDSTFFYTDGSAWVTSAGNLMQRVVYHYWYHTGEASSIRQMLGHANVPEFVGNIDEEAPFRMS